MSEPIWINKDDAIAIHERQLAEHGGREGVRDEGLLESALSRPRMLFHYEGADIFELAAAHADGLANNHPFIDGNKRTAFVVAVLFLEINGYSFDAPEGEPAKMTVGLADKTIDRTGYAAWLRDSSKKL
jgi:death-on-curing protein